MKASTVWLCILVLGLFLPIPLAVGSPAWRPAWLMDSVAAIPIGAWILAGLLVTFVALAWILSPLAFSNRDEDAR